MPVDTLEPYGPKESISASASAAPITGTVFAVPHQHKLGNRSVTIGWRYYFSSAPASVTIVIQGAFRNEDSEYVTFDQATNVSGEHRTVSAILFKFVRVKVTAKSGGGTVTAEIMV